MIKTILLISFLITILLTLSLCVVALVLVERKRDEGVKMKCSICGRTITPEQTLTITKFRAGKIIETNYCPNCKDFITDTISEVISEV